MSILQEVKRVDLLNKSKRTKKGKQRYNRRNKSSVKKSTKEMNDIDMNELFKDGILTVYLQIKGETSDYIIKIKFGSILKELQKNIESPDDFNIRNITRAIISCFNSEDTYIHCSCPDFCLTSDTKIKLLSGEIVTIPEIISKLESNEDIWVYSVDEKGDFKPGHVTDAFLSKYTDKTIIVTLDNGQTIECTPNHKFMMRDGSYKEAQYLNINESLMPLYFSYHNGYECVKSNSDITATKIYSVYKNVDNEYLLTEIVETNNKFDVGINVQTHHKIVHIEYKTYNEPIPVYDISVDKYNNFYLDAGVIVHNCYRFAYWASRNNFNAGPQQPSNGKWIRNPNDSLGSACKHVLLVLSNNRWIQTVARVIFNYVEYIRTHREVMYAKIIYPALYNVEYEEPTQNSLFDTDTLDMSDVKRANDERRTSTQFKVGNQQGYRFYNDDMDRNQQTLFGDNEEETNDK